jgi:hypothetical protein
VGAGLEVFAARCFVTLWLDRNYAVRLFWALGQAIVMTPISAIAMVGSAPNDTGAAYRPVQHGAQPR